MLAALSLADRELAERVIHETFHPSQPDAPQNQNRKSAAFAEEQRARVLGTEMRERVTEVVDSCREMLARELPERFAGFWATAEARKISRPLLKKLAKCRDPDRWDLVALQKARREQALAREEAEDGEGGGGGDGTVQGDGTVFMDIDDRDAKRRKVKAEDPFGGML